MECRPAEGPLTLVTRREAGQSLRTLAVAAFFSPAGFCAGRPKARSALACHEACPGLNQRLRAAYGRTLAFGVLGLVALGLLLARSLRAAGPVSGMPGGPPHNSGFVVRPGPSRAPRPQDGLLCEHMQALLPGQG